MRKEAEVLHPHSCLNRAKAKEMIFVLLARDEAAPVAIKAWVAERIRLEKNKPSDKQILEALFVAKTMEEERKPTAL